MERGVQSERGAALAEAVVVAAVATALAVSVIPLLATTAGAIQVARDQAITTALAGSKLDELRALEWSAVVAGPETLVAVSDDTTDVSGNWPGPGGAGLAPSPAGSLAQDTAGYVDFLDRDGRWVGAGPGAPPTARFVRRWAVAPAPWSPADGRILRVMAGSLDAERRLGRGGDTSRLPGDTWLAAIRTRALR